MTTVPLSQAYAVNCILNAKKKGKVVQWSYKDTGMNSLLRLVHNTLAVYLVACV